MVFSDAETRGFLKDPFYYRQITYLLEQFDRGLDPIFYHAPVVILVHSKRLIPTPREDCVLAAYNMVLMAESVGLGSCFVSLAQKGINSSPFLKRLLGMDSAEQVNAVIVLGYPSVQYHRPVYRDFIPIRRFDGSDSRFQVEKEASECIAVL
jgi:nitroreductase